MRTKHVLMSLALSATFAACSNEELINSGSLDKAKNELIELPEGFLLSGVRGGDATTKGAWEYGSATEFALKHAWMPTEVLVGSNYKYIPDMIGLSWTGVNGNVGISAATDMVHSNYKFTHYAWGMNGKVAEYDKCNKTYSNIKLLSTVTDAQLGRETSDGSIYYQNSTTTNQLTWPSYSTADNDADITTGFFNTENSTVYAGQYIVYAPFDKDNVSNYVTATSKASFAKTAANITKDNAFKDLNNEIFMYGQTVIDKGGIQAGSFSAKNLSGFILLKVSGSMSNLNKVMLYDAEGKFLTKVGLSAKGIIGGQTGTSLYLSDAAVKKEYSKFISVEFGANVVDLNSNDAYIAIPVLPTETAIKDLTVVCIDEDGKAIDRTISGNMTIPANGYASVDGGNAQWFEITNINNGEYKVATDATTLEAALKAANKTPENVNIMGDIELTKSLTIKNKYTLGVVKAGKIIIPGAETSQISLTVKGKGTLDVDVDVKENCCAKHPGKLIIEDATISANSIINVFADEDDEITNDDGQILFNAGTTADINNTVKGTINNAGNVVIGTSSASKKTTVTLDGGKIVNSGTMTILRSSNSSEGTNEYDGNLSLKNNSGAVLTNTGAIYVEGELSNYGTATNTGIIYDRVAAQVTGNRNIEGGGNYICDVNDNGTRFYVALNERPAVTAVRFVEKEITYPLATLSSQKYYSNVKKYIVDADTKTVTFQSTTDSSDGASKATGLTYVSIPALEVVAGTLKVSEKTAKETEKPLHLTVIGNVSIAKDAKMALTDGRDRLEEMFKAGNLTVQKGGELTVDNKIRAYIEGNVEVEGDKTGKGKIMFKNNTITDVHGDFINWGTVTITTGTSATNVAGEVWVNATANVKGADTSDKTYYPAGTPVVRP